jgi:hypothetical protein
VPPKQFGASVTPSFDGWFFNADGSQTFLVGYFNRNTEQEVDIPDRTATTTSSRRSRTSASRRIS